MRHFIDTNVLLYAAGVEHPYREACRRVLEAVVRGELKAATSAEVLQEVLHIYWRRGRASAGREMAESVMEILSPDGVLPVTGEDVRRAAALLELLAGVGLSPRDCLHLAVMERAGIERIVTADAAFDHAPGITRVDPIRLG